LTNVNTSLEPNSENEGKMYHKKCSNCGKKFSFRHKTKKIEGSGKPAVCPYCGDKYWDKPVDEAVLMKLQDAFVESGRDPSMLSPMYPKLVAYAENSIKNMMKNRKILTKEDLAEKSHDAACKVLERLLSSDDYVIHSSFGGNFTRVLQGVLFSDARNDSMTSLDSLISSTKSSNDFSLNQYSDSESSAFVSHTSLIKDSPELYEQKLIDDEESFVDEISAIIKKVGKIIREDGPHRSLLYYAGIYGFFNKKNNAAMNMFYTIYGSSIQKKVEKTKIFIRKYLREV